GRPLLEGRPPITLNAGLYRYRFNSNDGPLVCRMTTPCPGRNCCACGLCTQSRVGSGSAMQVSEAVPQILPSTGESLMSRKSNMLPPSAASQRPGPQAPRCTGSLASLATAQVKVGFEASAFTDITTYIFQGRVSSLKFCDSLPGNSMAMRPASPATMAGKLAS